MPMPWPPAVVLASMGLRLMLVKGLASQKLSTFSPMPGMAEIAGVSTLSSQPLLWPMPMKGVASAL